MCVCVCVCVCLCTRKAPNFVAAVFVSGTLKISAKNGLSVPVSEERCFAHRSSLLQLAVRMSFFLDAISVSE